MIAMPQPQSGINSLQKTRLKGLGNLCPDNLEEVLFSIFCQHMLIESCFSLLIKS